MATDGQDPVVRYDRRGPVAWVVIDRPQARNALSRAVREGLFEAVRRFAADEDAKVMALTGAGDVFCAGGDLKEMAEDRLEVPPIDFMPQFERNVSVDKPIIAAVNGAVAGMAFPLTLCCDLRVVSPEALFVTAFAQRGLIAEWGLSWTLPRLVGPAVALDRLFSSRRVGGDEAYRVGLANYLVDADELLPFCRQ